MRYEENRLQIEMFFHVYRNILHSLKTKKKKYQFKHRYPDNFRRFQIGNAWKVFFLHYIRQVDYDVIMEMDRTNCTTS